MMRSSPLGVGVGIHSSVEEDYGYFILLILEKMLRAQVLVIMVKFVIKLTLKQFSETKLNAQSWSIYHFLP